MGETSATRYRVGMPLVPYPTTDPPGVEFREPLDRRGRGGALWVPLDAADTLTACLEHGGGSVQERLAQASRESLIPWCVRAGVPFDALWFDGGHRGSVHRGHPLLVTEEDGRLRILLLEFWDSTSEWFGLRFSEVYDHAHAGRHTFEVDTGRRAFVLFGQSGVDRSGEPAVVEAFRARIAAGELGPHLPPGGNRDLVERWILDAGLRRKVGGLPRTHQVLRAGALVLTVRCWVGPRPQTFCFEEEHRTGEYRDPGNVHAVSAPMDELERFVTFLERRYPPARRQSLDDRLAACFDAAVAAGDLTGDLPRQGARDLVAAWFADAGVAATQTGFARTERLLRVHRAATDCVFTLTLTTDPQAGVITFREEYDYLPRPGDAGREYSYGVRTPYTSIRRLNEFLGAAPGGDPQARLAQCFRDLLAAGRIGDGLPLRQARDRIQALFAEAGVPAEPADSYWISSD